MRRVRDLKIAGSKVHSVTLEDEDIKIGDERAVSCLVAKVFSHNLVNRDTFRSQMPRILQSHRLVEIERVGDNIFLLEFTSEHDRRRALKDGPWNFFKDLVLFKEIKGLQQPRAIEFTDLSIWVQCKNLPLAFMNKSTLEKNGTRIGLV